MSQELDTSVDEGEEEIAAIREVRHDCRNSLARSLSCGGLPGRSAEGASREGGAGSRGGSRGQGYSRVADPKAPWGTQAK
jgi:hypothetical protein